MLDRLYSVLAIIAAACMGLMMAVTVADALGRYFFNAPLSGAVEYISYLLAILITTGYALITRDRGHIAVGVLAEALPSGYARIERMVTAVVTLVGCGFISWFLIEQALSHARSGRVGDTTGLPLAPLVFVLAAFAIVAVLFALELLRKGPAPLERIEERTTNP